MHSTVLTHALKLLLGLALLGPAATAQTTRADGQSSLRERVREHLAAGETEQAIREAQQALRKSPSDTAIRAEYIDFHLSLARSWLTQQRFTACVAALEAVRALEPEHATANRMLGELRAARERAGQQAIEIDRMLRLEFFEAALERIREVRALRPDLTNALRDQELAAWVGAADDHYLARNFNEALALYENILAQAPTASPSVHSRWAASLALALAEGPFDESIDPNAAGRLLARAIDVLRKTREPILGQIIGGLLAEQAGELVDAGRTYAQALGVVWTLPPVDRRRAAVRELRERAIRQARELYRDIPTGRRAGFWAIALPDVWKVRRTAHFVVHARNDLVAERVAEAAEFHFAGIGEWLGDPVRGGWEPRCEIRVHATVEELHRATGTKGITFAVTHTRLRGDEVVLRRMELTQSDPWLLSSTLPHELTHALVAEMCKRAGPPLAIDEGLAMHAEPPARRLMYRRLLAANPPAPGALLRATTVPSDSESFYAEASAVTAWLLDALDAASAARSDERPPGALLTAFKGGVGPDWWRAFGLEGEDNMRTSWAAWYAGRRTPHRMPLMILVEPSSEHRKQPR